MLRLSRDFIRVASLPSGAVSDLGLGSGCNFSVAAESFLGAVAAAAAAASSSSTSLRACTSACRRRASASLGALVRFEVSFLDLTRTSVVALTGAAGFALLVGLDSAMGCEAAVGSLGLAIVRSSGIVTVSFGCFAGGSISHVGSVGDDGADDEDIGRSIVI